MEAKTLGPRLYKGGRGGVPPPDLRRFHAHACAHAPIHVCVACPGQLPSLCCAVCALRPFLCFHSLCFLWRWLLLILPPSHVGLSYTVPTAIFLALGRVGGLRALRIVWWRAPLLMI
jgi:hypothetical protein